MISISNTFINLNSKQGLDGKLQLEVMGQKEKFTECQKHIHSCRIKAGPGWESLLRRGTTGEKCRGVKMLMVVVLYLIYLTLSFEHGLYNFTGLQSIGNLYKERCFCFGVSGKKILTCSYSTSTSLGLWCNPLA